MCDAGVRQHRSSTPMTPASELGFELNQLDYDGRESSLNFGAYVKACIVDLDTLIPHDNLQREASVLVFDEVFRSRPGMHPAVSKSEHELLITTCSLARINGIQSILESRGIELPMGNQSETAGLNSVNAVDNRREEIMHSLIARDESPVAVSETVLAFLKNLQSHGVKLALISTLSHANQILERAKLAHLFQTITNVDKMWELRHRPLPAPDSLLGACTDLGCGMGETVVITGTTAGIQAAREGNFGLIIGVKTEAKASSLAPDIATDDVSSVSPRTMVEWFQKGVQKDSWKLAYTTFQPALELQKETLTTVGNGYFSSRGSFELYDRTYTTDGSEALVHYPGHYINGLYSRKTSTVGGDHVVENTDLVNCPNWSMIKVRIGEDVDFISPLDQDILDYMHQVNLKDAVMERSVTFRDGKGRISKISSSRLCSMDLMHLAAITFKFTPLNYTDTVTIRSGIDASVENNLVKRYRGLENSHLTVEACGQPGYVHGASNGSPPFYVLAKVEDPATYLSTAVRNVVVVTHETAEPVLATRGVKREGDVVYEEYTAQVDADLDGYMRLDKLVAVFTSNDQTVSKDGSMAGLLAKTSVRNMAPDAPGRPPSLSRSNNDPLAANPEIPVCESPTWSQCESPTHGVSADYHQVGPHKALVNQSLGHLDDILSFHRVLDPHRQAWQDIWDASDVQIKGDRASQRNCRVHTYHLFVTASPHMASVDAAILARGLHGESYRGHVFWDEVYAFPFYISTFPEVCKAHLMYRMKRLPAARASAERLGLEGAMYPWQSADTGFDCTQSLHFNPHNQCWIGDQSFRQRHVNIAVFYDAWVYLERVSMTEEDKKPGGFRSRATGMMLEIAQCWGSMCTLGDDGRYHIANTMGPDEFHEGNEGLADNAYTNIMVVWLLQRAMELAKERPGEDYPLALWEGITKHMYVSVRSDGVLEQFKGFFDLLPLDMTAYKHRVHDISRMDLVMQAESKKAGEYQVLKQADTLLLWYLLRPAEVHGILQQLGYADATGDPKDLVQTNYSYYVPRTQDGSTLSYLVHGHVAALLGDTTSQWSWFTEAARADIFNRGGTTGEGIHCSVMAGSLDFITSWFAGLREERHGQWVIEPSLPSHWLSVKFRKKIRAYDYYFHIADGRVKLTLESDLVPNEAPVVFRIGSTECRPGPWSPVTIQLGPLTKMEDFYGLMHDTWHHRKVMCNNYFMGGMLRDRRQMSILKHAHRVLCELPKHDGKATLGLSGRSRVECDLTYEITELEKDIIYLERGESVLLTEKIRPAIKGFDQWVAAGLEFLKPHRFKNWITDRDGTTNNYCGRYNSSVQSVYNSIWLTRFALCCSKAVFITSAPLANPGVVNVSVNFEQAFLYAGSKGKEYIDTNGARRSVAITEDEGRKMGALNRQLKALCRQPEYSKFSLIGSGLQLKFAQTTVARQDICNTVRRKESEDFLKKVKEICHEVAPNGFEVIDTKLDIEIMPLKADCAVADDASKRGFDKGDGLNWLNEELGLDMAAGPNLITGDTSGDLPMVREAMRACPDSTHAIFVTTDEKLMDKVRAMCPRSIFLPAPDVLCYVLSEAAKFYVHNEFPDQMNKLFPL
eukprot:TRINITY_DN18201_c0_g1_i1.p1 TRINITY_DN18201_c0_g1~~TRINITY_DN18201_c0_g1_i1.p1  ORF type:complete len:1591 (+),score=551.66 TRINITY_DN18201_c0_g1_i1:138-4910(+)